jgi:hypothetical protein
MREERHKELQSAVEQSRIALTETHLREGLSENFVGHIENSPPSEPSNKNEELEQIHQHQRQLQHKAHQQKLLQKELSTISERTEQSSSLNGCLAAMAVSNMTNTTATAVSPQITNAISQSRATTVTKSIRHLDPNKFNFLDSSTGASADILSAKNANNSSGLLSTPVQTSNTNMLNNTNSSTKQTTDSNPKNEYFEFSNRSSETVVNNTIGTTSTSSTIIPNVKETVAKLNKCPAFIPRVPMESGAKRNDMHRQVTNNMFKSQLVDKGLMKFVEKKNRYIYGNVNENEEEDEVEEEEEEEEEEDESDTESDDEEEYNEQEQDFNDYVKRKDRMEDNRRRILESNHSHFGNVAARELNSCQNDRLVDECRKNSHNKSNYSSQEDFLSSLHVIISNF